MKKNKRFMTFGIRHKIFGMMLITIILIITAYTTIFFYQTCRVEQLVNETYEAQRQVYEKNGLQAEYAQIQTGAMNSFQSKMFHAQNLLLLLIVFIVAAGLISAYSVSGQIINPLNTITRRVVSLGIRHKQFKMEDVYRTGDEIEVLAEAFAKQSALTMLYIDQIKRVTAEKERISAELDMARKIQESQLPRLFPPFPDRKEFSLYASMTPAKEVGGDFYDFFMVDNDHIALVIADVSGKGVPAALFMMVTRVLVKSGLQSGKDPQETLESVNNQLCESNEQGFFVTMWVALLEISTGKCSVVNAGHEHPAVCKAGEKYELIVYKHAMPIGTMEGLRFKQHEFQMNPGDIFFVYTDGVAEATNRNNELYGPERMLDALNLDTGADPKKVLLNVKKDIDSFVDGAEQFDDITMLCLRYHGPESNK